MYKSNENETSFGTLAFACNCFHGTEDVIDVASSTELQVHLWLCTCMTLGQIERK